MNSEKDLLLKCKLFLFSIPGEEIVIPLDNISLYLEISKYKDECIDRLLELLDKETPMKPNFNGSVHECSVCNIELYESSADRYCSNCAYKIDWSEEE